MGMKLWILGITLMLASQVWNPLNIPAVGIVGAIISIIGAVLVLLNK